MADMSGHENFDLSDVLPIQKPGDLAEGLVENDHALNAAFHAAEHDPILDDPDYDEAEEDEALVTGSPAAPEDDDEELSDEQRRRLKQLQDDDLAAQERDAEEDQDKDARRQDEQDSKAEKMGEKDDDPKASGINNRARGIKDYGDYFIGNGKGKMSART